MGRIIVDADLKARLGNLNVPLELCDEAGNVVGWLALAGKAPPKTKEPQTLDEDELCRRELEPDFSTAEVLARLEKL